MSTPASAPAPEEELPAAPETRPLAELPFAAIDFESAGAAPGETDCPVQVGIVRVEHLFAAPRCFVSYIAPTHAVHWSASRVHGIGAAQLRGAPRYEALWPQLRELLGGAVVLGHNPGTEQRFLRRFPGHGFGPWLDTLALARRALPQAGDYALGSLCGALGIADEVRAMVPERRWHDALFDAAASLVLLRCLCRALHMEQAPLSGLSFALKRC
ncbi:MAG: exonuclease domain-containing protein [Akkermansia sp.]